MRPLAIAVEVEEQDFHNLVQLSQEILPSLQWQRLCCQSFLSSLPPASLWLVNGKKISEEILTQSLKQKKPDALLLFHPSLKAFDAFSPSHYLGPVYPEKAVLDFLETQFLFRSQSFIFAKGSKMEKVFKDLQVIAKSPALTVFVHGETGTGKELIAHEIHRFSPRKHKPFVEINVTALPPELLESELFGHEAGAFTGAKETKKGLFEVADKGTLFLDEIGDMDLSMQAKILRALQERKIRRVGGTAHIPVDIRLITATNRNLLKKVEGGSFRNDLFYRLNVVSLYLPPLRERGEDILALTQHFIQHFNQVFQRSVESISQQAIDALGNYCWPGNVRELKNMIEHALLLECKGNCLKLEDLKFATHLQQDPQLSKQHNSSSQPLAPLWQMEKEYIQKVLAHTQGNKNQAANLLQIDRSTLYNKIKKYAIKVS